MLKSGVAIAFLSFVAISADAGTVRGKGGFPECIGIAVETALAAHARSFPLVTYPVPKIEVGPSKIGPSNGIDVNVQVNGKSYEVIASPEGHPLKGCTQAYVTQVR